MGWVGADHRNEQRKDVKKNIYYNQNDKVWRKKSEQQNVQYTNIDAAQNICSFLTELPVNCDWLLKKNGATKRKLYVPPRSLLFFLDFVFMFFFCFCCYCCCYWIHIYWIRNWMINIFSTFYSKYVKMLIRFFDAYAEY